MATGNADTVNVGSLPSSDHIINMDTNTIMDASPDRGTNDSQSVFLTNLPPN